MAIQIKLENRVKHGENLVIPLALARRILTQSTKDELWEQFKELIDSPTINDLQYVHDIVNWVSDPQNPPPLTELMKWASVVSRVNEMEDGAPIWIIDAHEVELIYDRIKDPKFKYSGRVMDFLPFHMQLSKVLENHYKGA